MQESRSTYLLLYAQARRFDLDVDQPLQYRFNQKKAKYAQVAQEHNLSFVPAIFSLTGQIHQAVLDLMYNQIKLKLELIDPHTQESKIQETLRFWLMQLTCVINRTASRSILAGASSLVDSANAMLTEQAQTSVISCSMYIACTCT